ncbi:arsenate reductase [Rhodobacteraceae bacterium F11138]|nr:arsenate reductase [Rhodobacteraceae bacterium F11138]
MVIYGLKTCDTCRKALKLLPQAQFVDVRAQGVPLPVLQAAEHEFGKALLNTHSTTWRGLDQDQRDRPVLDLLADHPVLMKRPLIDVDGQLYLGWTPEVQARLGAV